MAEYLAEQMRSIVRRLDELAHATMPHTGLEGSLNAKQLAELLGVSDLQTFVRSMNKIRTGDADKLTRMEITELAEAFVRLLAAEAEDTQKAMMSLKRVSAREEPVMEASQTKKTYKHPDGRVLVVYGIPDGGEWLLLPNSQSTDEEAIASGEYYAGDQSSGGTIWVARGGKRGVEIANGARMADHKSAAKAIFQQFPNV